MQEFPEELSPPYFYEGMSSSSNNEMEYFSHSIESLSNTESESNNGGIDFGRSPLSQDLLFYSMILSNDTQSSVTAMEVIPYNVQGFCEPLSPFTSIGGNLDYNPHVTPMHDDSAVFSTQDQPNSLLEYPICSTRRSHFIYLMDSMLYRLSKFSKCLPRELSINYFEVFM